MGIEKMLRMYLLQIWFNLSETKIVCMPWLPVPICIRWRLLVESFPQRKSRGKSALLQKRKQLASEKRHI